MSPGNILGGRNQKINNENSINFWIDKYNKIESKKLNVYDKIDLITLKENFQKYCDRIFKKNNIGLIKIIRALSPISVFKPVIIELTDIKKNVKFDYVNKFFDLTKESPMLSMKSESLDFIFKNSFGFDTLTVNGCFEEVHKGGFVQATKTLAIENLNNLGIKIEIKTLFNFYIIKLFLTRLYRVARKLD